MLRKALDKVAYVVLRCFYKNIEGVDPLVVLGSVFFMQKIIGFNRLVPWPTHFTSRVLYPRRIVIGERSFPGFSSHCYVQARNGIEIGSNLRMGPGVGLISANHDVTDYDKWSVSPPITIGDNVWLGMNVVIMPGVKIADNVVVAANSVVTRDLDGNGIYAGCPAKFVKHKEPYKGKVYSSVEKC